MTITTLTSSMLQRGLLFYVAVLYPKNLVLTTCFNVHSSIQIWIYGIASLLSLYLRAGLLNYHGIHLNCRIEVVICDLSSTGDCHLTEWSQWSSCQLTCLEGRSFETVGRQARSQAVVIQVLENQDSCPHQVFETRPCKGTSSEI